MSPRRPLRIFLMIAIVLAGLAGFSPAHATATAPTFEPDPNSLGALTLFDSTGNILTNGVTGSAPFAPFVQAAVSRTGVANPDTKAALYLASPTPNDPSTWSKSLLGSATVYPNKAAPGALGTSALPLYTGRTTDMTLAALAANLPTSAYPGIYQLRIYTNGPGNTQGSIYDSLDISINATSNTFQVVFPVITAAVSAVTVDAMSPAAPGTTENLSASVTPAGLAGSVTFMDGTTSLGTSTYTQGTGVATRATTLGSGVHSLTAVFTPTDSTAVSGGTSGTATSFAVSPATTATSVVSVTPASPAAAGTSETLSATVTPAGSAGTVTFSDSGTAISGSVGYTASTGAASLVVTLPSGSHSLTASYVPSDATVTAASASASATPYTVSAATVPAVATTTSVVSVSPTSPAASGTSETLSATVSPAGSAGTVTFSDSGTALSGTVTYTASSGAASLTVTLPSGTHSLTASYTPADPTVTVASASPSPTSYTVSAAPSPPVVTTTSVVSVSPASPAASGTSETLSATVTPAGSAGTVTFSNSGSVLSGTVTYTASTGAASLTTVLPSGTSSLTANFVPTDATVSAASASPSATSYTVTAPANAPPFEMDPNSLGALSLYDASGNVVTSGSTTTAPFAAFVQAAVARTAAHPDTKAALYIASPTKDDPSTWSKFPLGAASVYPNPAAPGMLGTSALPLYTGRSSDATLSALIANLPTTVYPGIYQLRIYTNGPGNVQGSVYDSLDIMVDSTANTFTVIYPAPVVTTAPTSISAVSVDTSSPAAPGTTETLSATVAPANIAGTVTFKDGGLAIAGSVTYTPATGVATLSTVLTPGTHSLQAVFSPTSASYSGSSSGSATAFTVSAPVPTALVLTASPAGTQVDGQPSTFTATISPATATGSVAFYDGSANIGTTGLVNGQAIDTITLAGAGDHEISALYIPLDASGFSGSTSNTISYSLTEPVSPPVTGPGTPGSPVVPVSPVAPVVPVPSVILAPGLSGGGKVGNVEVCKSGEFANVSTFLYSFAVSGATVQNAGPYSTYLIKPGDLGKRLSCLVTAIGPGGQHPVSTQTVTVGVGTLLIHKGAYIVGKSRFRSTLIVKFGTYSAHPMKFTIQWLRDGKAIKGATHIPYKTSSADVGHKISVKVTAFDAGYYSKTTTTRSTGKIAA